ncbi:hypothetical protein KSP39_PZI011205 [Platanthera zijinensis]|uniref:Uncharacterized protein n=1 Tax=Platanthera zijinensis TaxID=2320716 RepID=A0AAP0BG81_9ASPA
MLASGRGSEMNSTMDEINLLRQAAQRHQLVMRGIGEEIDLEIGAGDDDPSFAGTPLVTVPHQECSVEEQEDHKQLLLVSQVSGEDQQELGKMTQAKRKKKVVKKWREEWADTYKWAYVDVHDGTTRIFCSVCREYGRKHRRNPYGNEGSRNMQMSALEEHNNSLLHKEALRLQMASKDKSLPLIERPVFVKALMSKTAGSIVESILRRDPHEAEFLQSVQEVVNSLEPVLLKSSQYAHILERLLEPERMIIFRVPWVDDKGETHVNRGFRVRFSQVLGPCRGGLRFHPTMNLSVAKFIAFEQVELDLGNPYNVVSCDDNIVNANKKKYCTLFVTMGKNGGCIEWWNGRDGRKDDDEWAERGHRPLWTVGGDGSSSGERVKKIKNGDADMGMGGRACGCRRGGDVVGGVGRTGVGKIGGEVPTAGVGGGVGMSCGEKKAIKSLSLWWSEVLSSRRRASTSQNHASMDVIKFCIKFWRAARRVFESPILPPIN